MKTGPYPAPLKNATYPKPTHWVRSVVLNAWIQRSRVGKIASAGNWECDESADAGLSESAGMRDGERRALLMSSVGFR